MSKRPLIVISSSPEWLEDERKRLKAENERLKSINVELLAACKAALTVTYYCGFDAINPNEVRDKIKAAIEKAKQ